MFVGDPLVHLRCLCVHKRIVRKRHTMSCNASATYPVLRHYSRALPATLQSTPFVAQALKNLRHEVGNKATVLGFVGLPYTLATYMVRPEKPLTALLVAALSPPRTATSHRGFPTSFCVVGCGVVWCAGGGWVVERVQGDQGLVLPAAAGTDGAPFTNCQHIRTHTLM